MAELTANVVLTNPNSGAVEFLAEGSTVPEWAANLIGSHVTKADDADGEDGPATPDKTWTNDKIVAYAAEHDIDLDGATVKADMLAKIEAASVPADDPDGADNN